jgi:Protein of unknown function (DUF1360)
LHPVLTFVLLALTSYRLTRLLVKDNFPPILYVRERLTGNDEEGIRPWSWVPFWLEYLAGCYWCVSVWTSAGVTLLAALTMDVSYPWLVWGGCAALAPWLCHLEDYFTRR